ncbi:MAG: low molecular weight phosphotyrosine protein phosphatase [Clostridia bacterium]|nr:low molecular weight phosphotyrosine protein phosphatase [Clostridia bacterium]
MIRLCFVCHGNICRSPMAEFIMKDIVAKAELSSLFHIESRATHTDEILNGRGSPIYPPAQAQLRKHGIKFDNKHAQQLKKSDYNNYDLFLGMDGENLTYMRKILGADPDRKIRRLMDYTARGGDVFDPWYTRDFDRAFLDISDGCRALLDAVGQK